jgi:hypothetical protein
MVILKEYYLTAGINEQIMENNYLNIPFLI